jgi:hypothetical protein
MMKATFTPGRGGVNTNLLSVPATARQRMARSMPMLGPQSKQKRTFCCEVGVMINAMDAVGVRLLARSEWVIEKSLKIVLVLTLKTGNVYFQISNIHA